MYINIHDTYNVIYYVRTFYFVYFVIVSKKWKWGSISHLNTIYNQYLDNMFYL